MADSGGSGSGGGGPSTTTGEVASAASASGAAFDPRNDPDCMQGMLYKKGRLRWAKRWVVLHDRVLFSYSSKTDTKSPERIPVVGYSVRTADEDSKRPFSFSLSHSGVRTMYWAAEDYGTLSAWLVVLFKATQNEDSKPHNPRQLSNMRSASIDDHPALRNSRQEARSSPLASAPDPVDDEDGEPSDDGVHSDDPGTRRASNAGAARRSMKRSASSGLGLKEAQAAADRQRQLTARKGASRSIKASDGRPDSGFRSNLNNILAMPGARPPLTRGVVRAGDGEAPPPKSQKPVRRPSGKTLPETTHAGPAPPGTMSEAPVVWSSSDDEAGRDAEEWADPEEGPVGDGSPTGGGDGDGDGGGEDDGGDDEESAPALPPRNNLPSVQAADQRLRNRTLTSEATTAAAKPSKGKPPPPSGGPPAKPQMPSRPSPKHMPAKLQRRRKTPSGRSVAVTETGDSDGEGEVASDDASSSVGIDTRPQGLRDSFKHNVAASLERQLAGAPPPKAGRPRPTVRPARATLQQSVSSERSDDQDDIGAEPAVDSNDYSDDDDGGDGGATPVVDAASDNDASEAATTAETSDPHAAPSTGGGGDGRTRAERLLALKKLTLTAWINSHSRARAHIISDLGEAVRGGVTLVLLAEVLTENICRGTRVPPRGEEAVLDNTRAAISLLKQTGWESDMSAADVVAASDHDACTFVYSLFVHFETRGKIRVGGARAARFSLPISPPADKIMPMADIVGVLYKLGGALGKKWQERSFILFGGILYYYKRGDTQAPAGTIILPSYVVEDWEHKKKAHAFCLSHTGCKTYYLAANSAAEKDRWISALSQAAAGRPVVLP